jgi:hypothetical protein
MINVVSTYIKGHNAEVKADACASRPGRPSQSKWAEYSTGISQCLPSTSTLLACKLAFKMISVTRVA